MGKPGARAVDKRMRFVTAVEVGQETMTALCRRFGLSRKTGYKWLERYRLDGIEGLSERSRAPREHPQAVSAAIAERCLAVRGRI
jgi:putative transposase